jgi:hypothetical protein
MNDKPTFEDDPRTGVFTTRHVLAGAPIRLVSHDLEGDWQFLCDCTTDTADGRLVCLQDIIRRDATVAEVADLPIGWWATRDTIGGPWARKPRPDWEADEDADPTQS